jgi:X-X-X-Leu-X-X-Gly heptad repeat protein
MDDLAGQLAAGMAQLRAGMAEATAPQRFIYIRVPWEEVNQAAADGFQMTALPPHMVLAPPTTEDVAAGVNTRRVLIYIMGRQLTPADEAQIMAEIAAEAAEAGEGGQQ